MDMQTLAAAIAVMKTMPDSAAASAAAAAADADRAEAAADSVTTGTLAEFKQYLGIT